MNLYTNSISCPGQPKGVGLCARTQTCDGRCEHGQPPQRGDGVGEVAFGTVQLANVPVHHSTQVGLVQRMRHRRGIILEMPIHLGYTAEILAQCSTCLHC